jgi:hypothetical protein
MKQNKKIFLWLSVLVLFASAGAVPQDDPQTGVADPGPAVANKEPGPAEADAHLDWFIGQWQTKVKAWTEPNKPPSESKGSMEARKILKYFIYETWHGALSAQPFEGHRTESYDQISKKYVSCWIDNMSNGIIIHATGTCAGDKCVLSGEIIDPTTGKKGVLSTVTTWLDKDNFLLEELEKIGTGPEMKVLEVRAKRKKM